ncbi:hypothetical protein [Helicobacter sp. 11S02629-2]|nr:hypothetical protein [Helicobacter sp. 11S02629-2]
MWDSYLDGIKCKLICHLAFSNHTLVVSVTQGVVILYLDSIDSKYCGG